MFGIFNRNRKSSIFSVLGTDMHCHLLPNVDDGSRNVNETVSCLKTLSSVGFKKIYITPHFQANYPNDEADIQKRYEQLTKELKAYVGQGLPEVAGISGEYRFDHQYTRHAGVDKVIPLPGKTLLCELALHSSGYDPLDDFAEYKKLGYNLILAHPERYPYLGLHSDAVIKMKDMGMAFQVNILSLNGFYGETAMNKGFSFIKGGIVEYLGTDLHNTRYANELMATARNSRVHSLLKRHTFRNNTL